MPPLPTLGTASSCFVPLAKESSPLPGALSCPCTRCGAVDVQTPLPFTALHQSVPLFLTRFPSVLSNVLPVRFPLEAATKNTAKTVAVIPSRRRRPKGRLRSRRGRIRSPPVRAAGSRPPPTHRPLGRRKPGWPIRYLFNRGESPILHLRRGP